MNLPIPPQKLTTEHTQSTGRKELMSKRIRKIFTEKFFRADLRVLPLKAPFCRRLILTAKCSVANILKSHHCKQSASRLPRLPQEECGGAEQTKREESPIHCPPSAVCPLLTGIASPLVAAHHDRGQVVAILERTENAKV